MGATILITNYLLTVMFPDDYFDLPYNIAGSFAKSTHPVVLDVHVYRIESNIFS